MKKIVSYIMILMALCMPITAIADVADIRPEYVSEYNVLNFADTLKAEDIEIKDSKYADSKEKINIYFFRGEGCGFCHEFLDYLNSIVDEYGKYFNMVSFEIWKDSNNSKLMTNVADFLGEDPGGVPFVIIGEKTFTGYMDSYNDSIKKAIEDAYNSEEKYDLFEQMSKVKPNDSSVSNDQYNNIISWMVIFTILSIGVTIIKTNYDKKQILEAITADKKNKK